MKYRNGLSLVVAMLLAGFYASADEIWVKGNDKSVKGTVKSESPTEVQVVAGKQTLTFPGADVLDVQYDGIKLLVGGEEYNAAKKAEKEVKDAGDPAKKKAAIKKAIDNYRETLLKLDKKDKNYPQQARHFKYRVAMLTLQQANLDGLPGAKNIETLEALKNSLMNSWQINHLMPLIAQMQMEAKDFKSAEETYAEMASMKDLPDDVRTNAELMVVQVSMRSDRLDEAAKKLEVLAKKPGGDQIFASRVKMVKAELLVKQKKLSEAEVLLHQVIKDNNDRQIKALAHNTLGECLFKAGQPEKALWEFLWVDTVYNQDRGERAKALYYLWQTFGLLNNAERAQECREMLVGDSQYAGTEYQALAIAKTK